MGWSYASWREIRDRIFGMGEDPVITDATTANDVVAETQITDFQEAAKAITDALAEVSSDKVILANLIAQLREAIALAYNSLCECDTEAAKKTLEGVVLL